MKTEEFSRIMRHEVRRAIAKARPNTLFEQAFYDIREKAKKLKTGWEKEVQTKLQNQVVNDLKSKGVQPIEAKLSLGKYRGSSFVTSFKLKVKVKDEKTANQIAEYLRGKYSPKWKVKKIGDDGVAELNVR
jgi:ribosomal protein S13